MNIDSSNRVIVFAYWVFSLAAVLLLVQAIADALPKHAVDASWLAHARFHVVTGAAFQVTCSLLVILIVRLPFRRCEKWSWYALLIYTLGFAVHIPAAIWQASGPPAGAWYLIAGLLLLMTLSLGLCWRHFHQQPGQ